MYLAVLQLGSATIQQIAESAKIKRTTVYLVARSLIVRGIVGQFRARRGIQLMAQPPEVLLAQLEEQTREFRATLPQLRALAKQKAWKPQVSYFEGKQGYFTICEGTLRVHNSEILWFGDPKEIYDVIGEKYDNEYYIPTRIKRKIHLRGLLIKNQWSIKLCDENNPILLRQIRFLPADFPFHATQFIYQNKIALISSTKELISVVIESRDLAEMERSKFELLWKDATKSP